MPLTLQISLSEIHKLVPRILQDFDLEFRNPKTTWTTKNRWFLDQESGLDEVVVRRR
jgi:hypothetical protein